MKRAGLPLVLSLRGRRLVDRRAGPTYGAVLVACAFLAAVLASREWSYDPRLTGVAASLAFLAGFGMAARWIGFARLGTAVEAAALFTTLGVVAPLCAVIAASTALPLADAALERADALLFFGFSRTRLVSFASSSSVFMDWTRWVYHSLLFQPFLLILLLVARGEAERLWTLLLAWSVALGLTLAVFPFFPAVGSPPYFFDFLPVFTGARDGGLRVIGMTALTGIITFPSFHAAAAVLLAWGFACAGRLAPVFVGLNLLMFWSALIAGHYLVDLVAGAAVAALAIAIAKRIRRGRSIPSTADTPTSGGSVETAALRPS